MQAVTWMSQHRMTDASNAGDIVNTKADFSFSGATVMTDMGGGKALGGWAVEVTSGADDEAVDGAPDELGADGSAKLLRDGHIRTEDLQDRDGRLGGPVERHDQRRRRREVHEHHAVAHPRRSFAACTSTDAGSLEVTYTTQTLRVYVHQENDQVLGYTGNVLGGDAQDVRKDRGRTAAP